MPSPCLLVSNIRGGNYNNSILQKISTYNRQSRIILIIFHLNIFSDPSATTLIATFLSQADTALALAREVVKEQLKTGPEVVPEDEHGEQAM